MCIMKIFISTIFLNDIIINSKDKNEIKNQNSLNNLFKILQKIKTE